MIGRKLPEGSNCIVESLAHVFIHFGPTVVLIDRSDLGGDTRLVGDQVQRRPGSADFFPARGASAFRAHFRAWMACNTPGRLRQAGKRMVLDLLSVVRELRQTDAQTNCRPAADSRMAWKLYQGEIVEEGIALIDDHDDMTPATWRADASAWWKFSSTDKRGEVAGSPRQTPPGLRIRRALGMVAWQGFHAACRPVMRWNICGYII